MNRIFDNNTLANVEVYGWKTSSAPPSCEYVAPQIIRLIRKLKLKRVVDLGAGNGALCSMIKATGCEVVGVEFDSKGCELARSRYPDIRFHNFGFHDDPEKFTSSEGVFEAAISTEVVEHLYAPHLLPRYASETVMANGYLIISTPYHGYLKNLALALLDRWDSHHSPLWHGGHIKFWSRRTLGQLVSQNGFEVVDFYGVGRSPYFWKSIIMVARKTG